MSRNELLTGSEVLSVLREVQQKEKGIEEETRDDYFLLSLNDLDRVNEKLKRFAREGNWVAFARFAPMLYEDARITIRAFWRNHKDDLDDQQRRHFLTTIKGMRGIGSDLREDEEE